ncbi:glycosyltransferase family 2 protein [Clostridium polynesiense]|uniref:glycosyltransferase family 2 protein n=1 Tax=Clostridium polynesiense TaxID=1325933 RepID=UPI00058CA19A|nr:glycosyltransferase family 2 protein [Clostridium polynesiense]
MEKVLLIIPAYNESKNIPRLIESINALNEGYDILVVNDCSTDNTKNVCRELGVNTINLPANLGIGGAMQTGYKYAYYNNYDIAVQVDGDGQHNPIYIKDVIREVKSGYNMCIGSRFINKEGFQSTLMRRVGITYFNYLIKMLTGISITDPTSGFRAADKTTINLFRKYYPVDYPEPETVVLLKKNGLKIKEIPVIMNERLEGKSSIDSFKSIYYMIKVSVAILITAMSSYKEV